MDSPAQQIKDRLSITEVVGQYVQLKKAGKNYTARCPFHKEKTPSFFVSPERGTYMCFGCGEKGDIFTFVEKIDGIDFPTALRQLAQKAGVELSQDFRPSGNKEYEERLHEVLDAAVEFYVQNLKERHDVIAYLRSRGVHEDTIETWRLGYAPAHWSDLSASLVKLGFSKDEIVDAGLAAKSQKKPGEIYDRFRGRIMFPIFDAGGRVIAFSGRYFEQIEGSKEEGEPAKYVNSPETPLFKKSKILYGFDRAKNAIRKADCILLVEGQFDLILSHQSGLPFTVALSGTALTPEHLSLLGRLSKRLVLALDADAAGLRSGLKSAHMALKAGFDVKVPVLGEGKDPADLARANPELLKAAIRTSKTAVEFFLDTLHTQAKDERGYKKIVETQVLPLIAAIESKIDQEHFIHIVAGKINVSDAAVAAEVERRKDTAPTEELGAPNTQSVPEHIARTPLERALAMLAYRYTGEDQEKLFELAGKERVENVKEKCKPEEEKLRFEFELLGEDEKAVEEGLVQTIERAIIQERIGALNTELKTSDESQHGKILKELSSLKQREQELRS